MPPAERIATFDQDGTLWVEHPMYSQVMYVLESVPALVKAKPELAKEAPYSTVLELLKGDKAAIAKLTLPDLEKLAMATLTGMSVDTFSAEAKKWLAEAKDPRWKKPYTELDLPADAGSAEATCAPMATKPTSSLAAARISCASIPRRSMAFHRSR